MCAERVEDSVETCSDGEDNDQDGYVDCDDLAVLNPKNDEVAALCGGDPEATFDSSVRRHRQRRQWLHRLRRLQLP